MKIPVKAYLNISEGYYSRPNLYVNIYFKDPFKKFKRNVSLKMVIFYQDDGQDIDQKFLDDVDYYLEEGYPKVLEWVKQEVENYFSTKSNSEDVRRKLKKMHNKASNKKIEIVVDIQED